MPMKSENANRLLNKTMPEGCRNGFSALAIPLNGKIFTNI